MKSQYGSFLLLVASGKAVEVFPVACVERGLLRVQVIAVE